MTADFADFLAALNSEGVVYVVIRESRPSLPALPHDP